MKIQDKIERILSISKADDCIVLGTEASSANVRWANNTSTTNGVANTGRLVVISIIDGSVGSVNSTYFPEDILEDLVRRSEAACAGKPKAPDQMPLPEGNGGASEWEEPFEETDLGAFGDVNEELGMLFKRAGSEDVFLFGYAAQTSSTIYLGTSAGARGRFVKRDASFQMNAKTPDFKTSVSRTTYYGGIGEAAPEEIYEALAKRLGWSKTTIPMEAGHYPVILEPAAVGELLFFLYTQLSARDADEGRTALSKPGGGNRIGEKLFPDSINIRSDPMEPGLESPPFAVGGVTGSFGSIFDNGAPVGRIDWVKDGVLEALITPRYWAAKTGGGPKIAVTNIALSGDESKSLDEIISTTDRALLVTRFWYTRMLDPQTMLLTGMTRDGVFLVENGEVKGAVNNFRYNMSPLATLAQSTELGPAERAFSITRAPVLGVNDFYMSSVSEAS